MDSITERVLEPVVEKELRPSALLNEENEELPTLTTTMTATTNNDAEPQSSSTAATYQAGHNADQQTNNTNSSIIETGNCDINDDSTHITVGVVNGDVGGAICESPKPDVSAFLNTVLATSSDPIDPNSGDGVVEDREQIEYAVEVEETTSIESAREQILEDLMTDDGAKVAVDVDVGDHDVLLPFDDDDDVMDDGHVSTSVVIATNGTTAADQSELDDDDVENHLAAVILQKPTAGTPAGRIEEIVVMQQSSLVAGLNIDSPVLEKETVVVDKQLVDDDEGVDNEMASVTVSVSADQDVEAKLLELQGSEGAARDAGTITKTTSARDDIDTLLSTLMPDLENNKSGDIQKGSKSSSEDKKPESEKTIEYLKDVLTKSNKRKASTDDRTDAQESTPTGETSTTLKNGAKRAKIINLKEITLTKIHQKRITFDDLIGNLTKVQLPSKDWKVRISSGDNPFSVVEFHEKVKLFRSVKFYKDQCRFKVMFNSQVVTLLGAPKAVQSLKDVSILLQIVHNLSKKDPTLEYI